MATAVSQLHQSNPRWSKPSACDDIRSVGLDCGPMSGFDSKGVAAEFFPGGEVEANFLVNLGHGDPAALKPRLPRFSFEEFCAIA